MKKSLKFMAMAALSLLLVACNNNNDNTDQAASQEAASSAVESQSSEAASSSTSESTSSDSMTSGSENNSESEANSDESASDSEANGDEAMGETAKFSFYIAGQEGAILEADVPVTENMSVLDAMESIDDLDFTFNEEEGVIDHIAEYENDYENGVTWTYLFNDQFAELGVVSQKLKAGDKIAWYYGTADDLPEIIIPAEEDATTEEDAE